MQKPKMLIKYLSEIYKGENFLLNQKLSGILKREEHLGILWDLALFHFSAFLNSGLCIDLSQKGFGQWVWRGGPQGNTGITKACKTKHKLCFNEVLLSQNREEIRKCSA